MSDLQKLEKLYNDEIKIDDREASYYRGLLRHLLELVLIPEMKRVNPDFSALYSHTYFGGSTFDGLKVGSTDQEFDLNLVFKWNKNACQIVNLGQDPKKKNFGNIMATKPDLSQSETKIVFNDNGVIYISPKKMFDLLKSSVDRVLTNLRGFEYEGEQFTIKRHEFAPVTLKVKSSVSNFEVDLVPSFQYDFRLLPREIIGRVTNLSDMFNMTQETRRFMAISLHRADQKKFELDFHDIERQILYNLGCVKKVIKLLKYMRDEKGGNMEKLWSHLLKTSVMHQVMENKMIGDYWRNDNLPTCFVDAVQRLLDGLKRGNISDIFFPEVNLLQRIKNPEVLKSIIGFLERKLRAFKQYGDILVFFE